MRKDLNQGSAGGSADTDGQTPRNHVVGVSGVPQVPPGKGKERLLPTRDQARQGRILAPLERVKIGILRIHNVSANPALIE